MSPSLLRDTTIRTLMCSAKRYVVPQLLSSILRQGVDWLSHQVGDSTLRFMHSHTGGYQHFDYARSFFNDLTKLKLFDQYSHFCDHHCDYLNKDIDHGSIWVRPQSNVTARLGSGSVSVLGSPSAPSASHCELCDCARDSNPVCLMLPKVWLCCRARGGRVLCISPPVVVPGRRCVVNKCAFGGDCHPVLRLRRTLRDAVAPYVFNHAGMLAQHCATRVSSGLHVLFVSGDQQEVEARDRRQGWRRVRGSAPQCPQVGCPHTGYRQDTLQPFANVHKVRSNCTVLQRACAESE